MKNLLNIFIIITCAFIIIYLGVKIYKELTPTSYKEKQLKCLEMGSNYERCLNIINK